MSVLGKNIKQRRRSTVCRKGKGETGRSYMGIRAKAMKNSMGVCFVFVMTYRKRDKEHNNNTDLVVSSLRLIIIFKT